MHVVRVTLHMYSYRYLVCICTVYIQYICMVCKHLNVLTGFPLVSVQHIMHVYTHSPLSPTSPVSLVILTCAVERGCGFSSTGGGCGCDRCSPIGHCHHSDGVVGTTVQSCQVVVGAITCSVD